MVRECTREDRDVVIRYLEEEAVANTFMLADIADFGFDKQFQTVYMDEEQGTIKGVYLCFYQNFLLYCKNHEVNIDFVEQLFSMYLPDVIMGNVEDVRQVGWALTDYNMGTRNLFLLKGGDQLPEVSASIQKAGEEDADDIFAFLQSIPQMRYLYTSKEMIADRIAGGTGVHYIIRKEGKIIAHANSAAGSEYSVMIGGVATAEPERGKGLAGQLVGCLCREILEQGKQPCLLSARGETDNLYIRLGFEKAGVWGTLTKYAPPEEPEDFADTEKAEKEQTPPEEAAGKEAGEYTGAGGKKVRIPSYISLYNSLYDDIVNGVYETGGLLPSENVLAEKYQVSRNTLRQALAILEQDGYIQKRRGKGTYISYDREKKKRDRIYNFLKESALEKITEITTDYNWGRPTRIACDKLKLEDGADVLAANNLYKTEEGPAGQSFVQIPVSVLEQYEVDRENEASLLTFMDETIYRLAKDAEITVQLARADEQVEPYLGIEEGTVLLEFEQLLYDKEHIPMARIKYFFREGKYQIQM